MYSALEDSTTATLGAEASQGEREPDSKPAFARRLADMMEMIVISSKTEDEVKTAK